MGLERDAGGRLTPRGLGGAWVVILAGLAIRTGLIMLLAGWLHHRVSAAVPALGWWESLAGALLVGLAFRAFRRNRQPRT